MAGTPTGGFLHVERKRNGEIFSQRSLEFHHAQRRTIRTNLGDPIRENTFKIVAVDLVCQSHSVSVLRILNPFANIPEILLYFLASLLQA